MYNVQLILMSFIRFSFKSLGREKLMHEVFHINFRDKEIKETHISIIIVVLKAKMNKILKKIYS